MHTSGYRTLSHEVSGIDRTQANRLESALQKLFFSSADKTDQFPFLNDKYQQYKKNYMKHIQYDADEDGYGMLYIFSIFFNPIAPALLIEHAPLEAVYIMFDTATYDNIERDQKVT